MTFQTNVMDVLFLKLRLSTAVNAPASSKNSRSRKQRELKYADTFREEKAVLKIDLLGKVLTQGIRGDRSSS